MDPKTFYNLSYGVFILGAKNDDKINACVTNTCIQVASEPARIAISVLNKNLTCDYIKNSGFFTVSVLDKTCTFDLIRHFGMQSGRDVNKFENFPFKTTKNGFPYIEESACSLFECKVLSKEDLGTHTLFIAEVTEAQILNQNEPLTYADYQKNIKPKNPAAPEKTAPDRKIVGWRCKICGFVYMYPDLPKDYICLMCGHPAEDFEPIYGV